MSKKHDALFDDVLNDLDAPKPEKQERAGARFLKRSTSIADRLSGEVEEKTLMWVDPEKCKMWDRHNRDYALLNQDNCADLIDGIKSQGQQEFPAIVRRLETAESEFEYEVICGARRHFVISWLRANNYPQFKYLIEVRDLTDEEAFRLADIENRDREDISDYERAIDYAAAVKLYYGGKQKDMAERLQVSPSWLSRYIYLSTLPSEIVAAYQSTRDIKERHARDLKPHLSDPARRKRVIAAAVTITHAQQERASAGQAKLDGAEVLRGLLKPSKADVPRKKSALKKRKFSYDHNDQNVSVTVSRQGKKLNIECDASNGKEALKRALVALIDQEL